MTANTDILKGTSVLDRDDDSVIRLGLDFTQVKISLARAKSLMKRDGVLTPVGHTVIFVTIAVTVITVLLTMAFAG